MIPSRSLSVLLIGAAALASLFLLFDRIGQQSGELDSLRGELAKRERALEVGARHPESRHLAIDGSWIELGVSERGTELVFFLPTCPACQQAAPTWNDKAERLAARGVDFVAVASSELGLPEFAARFQPAFPIITDLDSALGDEFGVTSYPTALSLDRRGKVQLRDTGVLAQDCKRSSLAEASREWPAGALEALVCGLASGFDAPVQRATSIVLRAGAEPIFALEGADELLGFAALCSREVPRTASSNLECLLVFDPQGEVRGLLPLIQHVADGRLVSRDTLRAWTRPRELAPGRVTPLQRALHAELDELRAQLQLPPAVAGVALAGR